MNVNIQKSIVNVALANYLIGMFLGGILASYHFSLSATVGCATIGFIVGFISARRIGVLVWK